MVTGLVAVLVVAAVLAGAYRYASGPGRHVVDRFDRYPPHAPMADWTMPSRPDQVPPELIAPRTRRFCLGNRTVLLDPTRAS